MIGARVINASGNSIDVVELARESTDSEAVVVVVPLIRDLYSNLRKLPSIEKYFTGIDVDAALATAAEQKDLS